MSSLSHRVSFYTGVTDANRTRLMGLNSKRVDLNSASGRMVLQ